MFPLYLAREGLKSFLYIWNKIIATNKIKREANKMNALYWKVDRVQF